jgi:hypothetical protein
MTELGNELVGASLAGRYELHQWVSGAGNGALFLTSFGPEARPALLRLVHDAPPSNPDQLELWRRISRLSHRNLLPLLDCGRTEIDDDFYVYAILENPDDRLETALENGPLTESDVREVLDAVTDGLRYVHERGLVHASIDPEHVVALGDRIVLVSETLEESGARGFTPADDVRALGELAYRLLTGHRIVPGGASDLSTIGEPMRAIIEHTVDPDPETRWGLAQIAALLHPEPSTSAPDAMPAAPPPAEVKAKPFPKWVYAACAVVALVGIFWLGRRTAPSAGSTPSALSAPSTPAQTAVAPPVAAAVVSPAPVVSAPAKAADPVPAPAPAPAPVNDVPRNWRVIAYTYAGPTIAEKKARLLNETWPDIQATVFAPKRGGMFLISLGGRMTREEAVRVQHKALSEGVSRDAYIQNYVE